MRRTERLFQIIQILRTNRFPVTGRSLADELEISIRTLYRDMAELIAQRVPITGEAGMGYVLDEGYDMPPLMLTPDELEAAALGAAWVEAQGDASLGRAARDLVSKLSEAVPQELRPIILDSGSRSYATGAKSKEQFDSAMLRRAIRDRLKLNLKYQDQQGGNTERVIWPLLIAYLDSQRYIVAWCESRQGYRHFRADRVQELAEMGVKYPGRRAFLVKAWEEEVATRNRA